MTDKEFIKSISDPDMGIVIFPLFGKHFKMTLKLRYL